eukprot:484193-Pyramimonas_sp.AAC.1
MIPRPPTSPPRSNMPAGMFPAVSATAAAWVGPNSLAAARALGLARPQNWTSERQALVAIATAWVLQTKLRVGR